MNRDLKEECKASRNRNSIYLFKRQNSRYSRENSLTSLQKQSLKNQLKKLNSQNSANKTKSPSYCFNNKPYSNVCNMEDPQRRIKRNHSPLYQRSITQSDLFEKGIKKPSKNINLHSQIKMVGNLEDKSRISDVSATKSARRNPNHQTYNILELDKVQPQTSRSVNKRDPNRQTEYCQKKTQKKYLQNKNSETNSTADYVVKGLSGHISNNVKQVHLKFTKTENTINIENYNNGIGKKCEQALNRQHRKHYSTIINYGNKQNLQIKQNGISVKDPPKSGKLIDFNHDFYNNEKRLELKTTRARNATMTERGNPGQPSSRVGQLRKKFL